jgi:hypothetical protein
MTGHRPLETRATMMLSSKLGAAIRLALLVHRQPRSAARCAGAGGGETGDSPASQPASTDVGSRRPSVDGGPTPIGAAALSPLAHPRGPPIALGHLVCRVPSLCELHLVGKRESNNRP